MFQKLKGLSTVRIQLTNKKEYGFSEPYWKIFKKPLNSLSDE